MTCDLYRVYYYSIMGYVVYRHCFSGSVFYGSLAHKTAVFVTEEEARDYCEYRNRLTEKNGSDSLQIPRLYL